MNCTELIVHSSTMIELHTMKFNYEILYKENYKQHENHDTGRIFKRKKLHRSMMNSELVASLKKNIIYIRLTNQNGSNRLTNKFPKFIPFRGTKKKFSV